MEVSVPGRTATGVAKGELRRTAIVESATHLFAEKGIQATTLTEIAQLAGMKRPALLHHFESKEAVVHAVLDGHERLFAPVQYSIARHRGLDAITHLIEIAEFDFNHRARVALWNQLLAEASSIDSSLRERIMAHYMLFRASVRVILEHAEEDGELKPGIDRHMVANTIIDFFNGIETSWLLDPDVPMVETTRKFLDDTVKSLRKE